MIRLSTPGFSIVYGLWFFLETLNSSGSLLSNKIFVGILFIVTTAVRWP